MYDADGNYQAFSGYNFDNLSPSPPCLPELLTCFERKMYVDDVDPRERFYVGLPATPNNGTAEQREDLAIPSKCHKGKMLHHSNMKSNRGINGDSRPP
jgi:hypothetical protein